MAHIDVGIQVLFYTYRKSDLEFQDMMLSMDLNKITREMADATYEHQDDEDYDPDSDLDLRELQYQQQIYDGQQKPLESELKEVNGELENLKKLQDANTKSDSSIGGSAH